MQEMGQDTLHIKFEVTLPHSEVTLLEDFQYKGWRPHIQKPVAVVRSQNSAATSLQKNRTNINLVYKTP